jgi:hypothetical protein
MTLGQSEVGSSFSSERRGEAKLPPDHVMHQRKGDALPRVPSEKPMKLSLPEASQPIFDILYREILMYALHMHMSDFKCDLSHHIGRVIMVIAHIPPFVPLALVTIYLNSCTNSQTAPCMH